MTHDAIGRDPVCVHMRSCLFFVEVVDSGGAADTHKHVHKCTTRALTKHTHKKRTHSTCTDDGGARLFVEVDSGGAADTHNALAHACTHTHARTHSQNTHTHTDDAGGARLFVEAVDSGGAADTF